MRILHTADWHLGSRLAGRERDSDLYPQVTRVCDLAVEHHAQVLLVAGDVFESRALPTHTKRLAEILAPYVRDGLHVVFVPGNHDSREHFAMMDALLTLEQNQRRHVHVIQTRSVIEIEGFQFAVVPYPLGEVLDSGSIGATGATRRNTALSTAYANVVRAVAGSANPGLPSVFVAHVTVAGVTTPSEHELSYDDDLRLGRADLPLFPNLAYIALGHIHQHQVLDHPVPCHYSGSIDRLNLGERLDEKCVLLVDVDGPNSTTVTAIPLRATPFHDIEIAAHEVDTLPGKYPDLQHAFVRVAVRCEADHDRIAVRRTVKQLCPRLLDCRLIGPDSPLSQSESFDSPRDFRQTALDYVRRVYADAPDLSALEARTNDLLLEVSSALGSD